MFSTSGSGRRTKSHVWACEVVQDRTRDGRVLTLLVVADEFGRACLAIEAARRLESQDVVAILREAQILIESWGAASTPPFEPTRHSAGSRPLKRRLLLTTRRPRPTPLGGFSRARLPHARASVLHEGWLRHCGPDTPDHPPAGSKCTANDLAKPPRRRSRTAAPPASAGRPRATARPAAPADPSRARPAQRCRRSLPRERAGGGGSAVRERGPRMVNNP